MFQITKINIPMRTADEPDNPSTDTLQHVLGQLLARANAGAPPAQVTVALDDGERSPEALFARAQGCDQLLVRWGADGRLEVTIAVAVHWTTVVHPGCRFALTPGAQFILLGRHAGRPMWWWVEDGRLLCDQGSPLTSFTQEVTAIAAFDAEFARMAREAR